MGMQIFNFVVLSVIIAHNVLTTITLPKPVCLLFYSVYVNSNWTDAQKSSQGKKELPLTWKGGRVEVQLPTAKP